MTGVTGPTGTLVNREIGFFIGGKPSAAANVFRYNVIAIFKWPASLPGCIFTAATASTGTATFTILRNGASIGTVTFTSSATGVATFASDVSFANGDVILITAPGSQDATLADISFNFTGPLL
jgi:hypothetical protein